MYSIDIIEIKREYNYIWDEGKNKEIILWNKLAENLKMTLELIFWGIDLKYISLNSDICSTSFNFSFESSLCC
ncbi:MAG: hypothetical protein PWQ59_545 [Thermoanaerobacterium sp.]|nr:hypothetical protein [Thermoanaerobacterium sp.]